MSQLKIKDGNNWVNIPASGIGVPSGGTTGQVLQKSSNTDYATEWAAFPIKIDLLWTNPNPNEALSNGTIIFSDDYPLYLMIYKRDKDFAVENSVIFEHGVGCSAYAGSGYYNKFYERGYPWLEGGGLTVQSGYAANNTATTNVCIALKIYGIKF